MNCHQSGSLESGSTTNTFSNNSSNNNPENETNQSENDHSHNSKHKHSNIDSQHHRETSREFSQFRTVATATKFWLQHMLREHNLRKGITSDIDPSDRPKTPAVKNLSQFLSSAIEHIRWSCTAAGWDAPKQKDLERHTV